ncbi:MAG: glycosyltransferase [Planctomycetes bacterium]|nr:glycosyltransferase [Planctomycetota bacterium]
MSRKISINLCCYNSEKYLKETLDSIVNQTYKDWELIIINDGSCDSTESIIDHYIKQGYPIVYKYQENQGLSSSRNEAIRLSCGDYIAFIDHDDMWLPHKLETQLRYLQTHPECGFLYSNAYVLQDKKQRLIFSMQTTMPEGSVFRTFLVRYPVNMQTVVIKKTLLDNMDHWFDKKLDLSEEYDFFLRFLHNVQAGYQREPLIMYRLHSNMSTVKKFHKIEEECLYILDKLRKSIPNFEEKYQDEIRLFRSRIASVMAAEYILQGEINKARSVLRSYMFVSAKYFVLYLMTYMPVLLYVWLHEMRGGIILRQRLRYLRSKKLSRNDCQ